jgi:hypothetical protein
MTCPRCTLGLILLVPNSLAICLFSNQLEQAMDGLLQVLDGVDLDRDST